MSLSIGTIIRDDILRTIQEHRETLHRLGVRRIALFGSAARGEASETSDLDFVVELEHKTFDAYMDVKFFLQDLFGRRVDLVLKDAIKPRLRDSILKEAVDVPGFYEPR